MGDATIFFTGLLADWKLGDPPPWGYWKVDATMVHKTEKVYQSMGILGTWWANCGPTLVGPGSEILICSKGTLDAANCPTKVVHPLKAEVSYSPHVRKLVFLHKLHACLAKDRQHTFSNPYLPMTFPSVPRLRISPRPGGRRGGAESGARRIWRRFRGGGAESGFQWMGAVI